MNCETNDCRKEKRGCKGCFYDDYCNKEITADEMFEKLKYKKRNESEAEVKYCYNETLIGDRFVHTLLISKISKNIFHIDEIEGHCIGIGIDLLQAINKKVEELGWK